MSHSSPPFSPISPDTHRSDFPFPTPDTPSSFRQGLSQRPRPRRGSSGSIQSISSIGGSLDAQNRRSSTLRETSQNAISSLLQPPIVRTGLLPHTQASAAAAGYKAPTSRDIPPVALTNIPHVPPENFRDYLNRIGPLFETFRRAGADPEQPQWMKKDRELEKTDRFAQALERRMSRDGATSPTLSRRVSTNLLSPVEAPGSPSTRRKGSAQSRRGRNEPTPLSTIPPVYFEEDFHLEDPRTFDVVSERAEIVRPVQGTPTTDHKPANGAPLSPRKNLASNAILQEKLSWYMDTVEVHLINSISAASAGFFTALGSLKELQTEAEQSVAKIQRLREDLKRLDKEVAVGGLEVAAKRRRKENVKKLRRATEQVGRVIETVKRTDEMVDEGKYDEAADQMDVIQRIVRGEADARSDDEDGQLLDLRSLKALEGLQSGMQELHYRIGTGFAQRFTTTLLADLRSHIERVPPTDTLKRWSRQRGIPPTYMETSDQFRTDLMAGLKGLARCGHTAPAVAGFREAAMKEMKAVIRKHLPSSTDDDMDSTISSSTRGGKALTQQEKSSILARNLRALDPDDAQKLLVSVYTAVGETLRRLSTQTKVLLDVTSQMQSPESRKSADQARQSIDGARYPSSEDPLPAPRPNVQEDLSQALDMSSLLGQAVDTAQTQITRVLKVRNEQSVRLSKEHFMRYFTLNRLFADECEAVSGRGGQALRGVINAQISGFVQVLGQVEIERIAASLDSDKWDAIDMPEQGEVVLARVLGSVERDAPEWQTSTPVWEPLPSAAIKPEPKAAANGTSTPATNGTGTAKPQARPATIDSNKYTLVSSAAAVLPAIDTFLSLTCVLPSMTPQVSASLLEVLRTFNSRSCQLILGAGATRSAGLKNITTKHLALASQALSFVTALVPYQRECIRRHLSGATSGPGQAVLAEWDKTKRLYQEHQVGIHEKLVEIMSSRSQTHVKAMLALDFGSAAAADAAGEGKPSPYMETLIKETLTLHRVLARHLAALDVNMIMRQISGNYRTQWTKAFADVEVRGGEGERRLVRDATAMEERLGRVEEFREVGTEIVAVVKARVGDEAAGKGKDERKDEGEKRVN